MNNILNNNKSFYVAPMLDWTDRHCRYLFRLMSKEAVLFTEMVTSAAIIHGKREHLLGFDEVEHPIVVQIAGSDAKELAMVAKICQDYGYDEINLNVGCPSDRVQSGSFGACLMKQPSLVAQSVKAMVEACDIPISVKCRIGVDDQNPEIALNEIADEIVAAGVNKIYVHARKAWLQGLSPKENRDVPPLDYEIVYRLAERLKSLPIIINGGIENLEQSKIHFEKCDGVMLGRAAYHNSFLLADVDAELFGKEKTINSIHDLVEPMMKYADKQMQKGVRLNQITRHMLGLATGQAGAKTFRRILSVEACKEGAKPKIIAQAFAALSSSLPLARRD